MEKVTLLTDESPFGIASSALTAPQINGSDDWYGACSIETFAGGVGSLHATHRDAEGFLDYPTGSRGANFWFKDASVKPWLYGETYDNYLDTYGADAVTAFYHSGHGAMDANGVFYIPTGGVFGGTSWADSRTMFLGNEEVRYVFFSTCESCRVLGGQSPIRTWWDHCLGFRMLFGFETVSIDNPNYGKFFWEEWRRGKSFSQAWLDASWRISSRQSPSVVAVGANQAEALNRLNTERLIQRTAVTKGWMQWRWYNATTAASAALTSARIPQTLTKLEFRPAEDRLATVQRIGSVLGFARKDVEQAGIDPAGNLIVQSGKLRAIASPDGGREYHLNAINFDNRQAIDDAKARRIAEKMVAELDLDSSLAFDSFRVGRTRGGTNEGSGQLDAEYTTDIGVLFRPVIDGTTNVNSDHGNLLITVDNDGAVTTIRDTTRPVDNVREVKPFSGPKAKAGGTVPDVEQLLKTAIKGRYARAKATLLPESIKVGYDYSGKTGDLVAHALFDLDFGKNMHKQAVVRVPVLVA